MSPEPLSAAADHEDALARDYSPWIGVERRVSEVISSWPARALAATLDRDPAAFADGAPLPGGWHWLHFHEPVRASSLGADGHEARGDFLPPVPLSRRMWAGGRIRLHAPLRIGDHAERISIVERVVPKRGRSGPLVFVTVRHRVVGPRGLCVDEEQEIVYREPAPAGSGTQVVAGKAVGIEPERPDGAESVTRVRPDPVMLFRFSALTFNGHRIHYDRAYATEIEGYPALVVHGPLLALLLLQAGLERTGSREPVFTYRAVAPVFCGDEVEILAERDPLSSGQGRRLWAFQPDRGTAMQARVE